MARRPDRQVIRGEIDNRTCGRVRGRIWMVGMAGEAAWTMSVDDEREQRLANEAAMKEFIHRMAICASRREVEVVLAAARELIGEVRGSLG